MRPYPSAGAGAIRLGLRLVKRIWECRLPRMADARATGNLLKKQETT